MSSGLPRGLADLERATQSMSEQSGPATIVRLAAYAARAWLGHISEEEVEKEFTVVSAPFKNQLAYSKEKIEVVGFGSIMDLLPEGAVDFICDIKDKAVKTQTVEYVSLFRVAMLECMNIARPESEEQNGEETDICTDGMTEYIQKIADTRAKSILLLHCINKIMENRPHH